MMVHTVYRELLADEGLAGFLAPTLSEQTVERLVSCQELGGRELKREIVIGVRPDLKLLQPEHLRLPEKAKRTIGFY